MCMALRKALNDSRRLIVHSENFGGVKDKKYVYALVRIYRLTSLAYTGNRTFCAEICKVRRLT